MLATMIACMTSLAAASLVFHGWRHADARWAARAGWLAAFGSAWLWSLALGPEVGVSYAVLVFVCLVWVEIALTAEARKAAVSAIRRPFQGLYRPGLQDCFRHGVIFLLSVPAMGVIAMLLSVALVLYLPWTMPVKFAVAILLYPLLWGALSAWICAQSALLKPTLASLGLLAVSSLLLFT